MNSKRDIASELSCFMNRTAINSLYTLSMWVTRSGQNKGEFMIRSAPTRFTELLHCSIFSKVLFGLSSSLDWSLHGHLCPQQKSEDHFFMSRMRTRWIACWSSFDLRRDSRWVLTVQRMYYQSRYIIWLLILLPHFSLNNYTRIYPQRESRTLYAKLRTS